MRPEQRSLHQQSHTHFDAVEAVGVFLRDELGAGVPFHKAGVAHLSFRGSEGGFEAEVWIGSFNGGGGWGIVFGLVLSFIHSFIHSSIGGV